MSEECKQTQKMRTNSTLVELRSLRELAASFRVFVIQLLFCTIQVDSSFPYISSYPVTCNSRHYIQEVGFDPNTHRWTEVGGNAATLKYKYRESEYEHDR